MEELQKCQEDLSKELRHSVALDVVAEDRIAEIFATYFIAGMSDSRDPVPPQI